MSEELKVLADSLVVLAERRVTERGWLSLCDLDVLRKSASALRRIAATDQKPVAWRYRDFQWADERWHVCAERPNDIKGRTIRPLYAEPPPAAGWDDAIEAARLAITELDCMYVTQDDVTTRYEYAGIPADPESAIFREVVQKCEAAVKALRHNAPPDSGAGKSDSKPKKAFDETFSAENVLMESFFPDHGGADAGVGVFISDEGLSSLKGDRDYFDLMVSRTPHPPFVIPFQPAPVAANASAEARDFCTYGPPNERKRQWIIIFEDADQGMMIFSDEREAHTAWDKAKDNWTCTLFETSERKYHWAAGELRPLNASAEARLRGVQFPLSQEALSAFRAAFQNQLHERHRNRYSGKPMISAEEAGLKAMLKAVSTHPHASDCDKQKQATERWLKDPAVQEAVERRPSDRTNDVTAWPAKCHDPESCARHRHCMYFGCIHKSKDIKTAIDAFTVGRR